MPFRIEAFSGEVDTGSAGFAGLVALTGAVKRPPAPWW
jgi:hypothetical protein